MAKWTNSCGVGEDGDDYREWINSLMDEFRNELEQKPEVAG